MTHTQDLFKQIYEELIREKGEASLQEIQARYRQKYVVDKLIADTGESANMKIE